MEDNKDLEKQAEEAKKAEEKAKKEALKAEEKAKKEALKAEEKARKESEKAEKEALKAKEKAAKEAAKAKEAADREAEKIKKEALKADEAAKKEAEKAKREALKADEAAKKEAERAKREALKADEAAKKEAERAKKEAAKFEAASKKEFAKAQKEAKKEEARVKKEAARLEKEDKSGKTQTGNKDTAKAVAAAASEAAASASSDEHTAVNLITPDTILVVKNLTKVFKKKGQDDFTAVDHVSFTLNKGECLGIVGESGSGKSTIVKMITRLLDVTEGSITFNGKDVTHVKGKEQRELYKNIQMVFQMPFDSFDPRHNLGAGVGESLRNAGMSKEDTKAKVKELLEMCGLDPEFADRYPHQVSGGQCQRAAIARAIAIEPEILVCDEATSALDVTVQKQVLSLLVDLQKKMGMAYLFISHDLAVVQQICDKVIVLYHGKIVESGTPEEVITHPKDPYTKNLVASVL